MVPWEDKYPGKEEQISSKKGTLNLADFQQRESIIEKIAFGGEGCRGCLKCTSKHDHILASLTTIQKHSVGFNGSGSETCSFIQRNWRGDGNRRKRRVIEVFHVQKISNIPIKSV